MSSFFLPVRQVMNPAPVCIAGLASVQEALETMKANDISSLIVERRDPQDEFGIVLLTDVAREVIGQSRSITRTSVYEIMVKPAPAVDADMNIKYAIRHMSRLGLSHCLVLEGRELVGLVSLRQLALRYFEEAARQR